LFANLLQVRRSLFRKITDTVIGTTRRSSENGDVDEVDGNKEIE
jgi:hypothetical protein